MNTMKKILFPVLMAAAFLTACHDDEPGPEALSHTVITSIRTVGKYETLDSLEYNTKGQLVKHLVFDVEDEELTLNSYSVYTYSSNSIEKKSYSAAGAAQGEVTFTLSSGFITSNGTVSYTYDNDRLSKTGNLTLTYQNGDLVSDSAGYTYTPSNVANPGWWPIDIDNVDAPLYWMGLYGNKTSNLVEKWSATIDGVSHTGNCEYELEAGRLTNVTKTVIVKTGLTPSISDYFITIKWKDL